MKASHRNLFLAIGVTAVIVMLYSFDLSLAELGSHIHHAGIWLPAAIALWFFIYLLNALSWYVIIGDEGKKIGYWRVLKYTITGFALNGVTPVGVMGSEPYRIMELKPYLGVEKASSSVILYSMMHIFSHFCFWAFSILLFLGLYASRLTATTASITAACATFTGLGIYLFVRGYKHGLVGKALAWCGSLPLVGKRIAAWHQAHHESILNIDSQIASLHTQRRAIFHLSLWLEFAARIIGCLELMFIMRIMAEHISFTDCLLMQAFSSLLANLIFFIPMQMGTREGGMALFTDLIGVNAGYGVLTGLVMRLRELFWIVTGMAIMKIGNKQNVTSSPQ